MSEWGAEFDLYRILTELALTWTVGSTYIWWRNFKFMSDHEVLYGENAPRCSRIYIDAKDCVIANCYFEGTQIIVGPEAEAEFYEVELTDVKRGAALTILGESR
jgi:hypothetical protein